MLNQSKIELMAPAGSQAALTAVIERPKLFNGEAVLLHFKIGS